MAYPTNEELSTRLSMVRRYTGHLNLDDFAAKLGVLADTYRNYEAGVSIPGNILLKFIDVTQVSTDYLLTGTMPMFNFKS